MADMNGYGLIAVIIQSFASLGWPIAFVVAIWLLREKLVELLPKLHLKHKDWEVGFRLEKAEAEAAALPPAPVAPPEALPTPEERSRFEQIARASPRAAMLELRAELEEVVRRCAERYGVATGTKPAPMINSIRKLRSLQVIDEHTSAILDDLRNVGNAAAHGGDSVRITEEDALRYRKLGDQVIARLNARQGEL
jgi:hypothetical protein